MGLLLLWAFIVASSVSLHGFALSPQLQLTAVDCENLQLTPRSCNAPRLPG